MKYKTVELKNKKRLSYSFDKIPNNPLYTRDKEFKKHIGEYCYEIFEMGKLSGLDVMKNREVYFVKTLESLKKKVKELNECLENKS